ncbi:MAG: alpha/beta hydrolase [Dehalococcoidia bacterium]|nr:alpha/beta hydrolase [Dehalococcoidia bacterium]
MARLTVNGAELAIYEAGSGDPAFVFLHGMGADHTAWQPQFDDLSRDHRCIAIDFRGCGDSAPAPPFDTTQAADDVAEVILELGLAPAIIAGHSSGGLVALLLNDRHPETVLGIVLGDAPLTSASGGGWAEAVNRIDEAGSVEPLLPLVESFFTETTGEDVRERVRSMMLATRPEVAAGMLSNAAVFTQRMGELLKQADEKPFMAIWSAQPRGNPERLRETLFFIRQEPIAEAGHYFQLERPDVTNALLRAFLDDVERDPRVQPPG